MRQKLQPLFNAGRMDLRTGQFRREQIGWAHWCPGCGTFHGIKFDSGWKLLPRNLSLPYNPQDDRPTFEHTGNLYFRIHTPERCLPCAYRIVQGEICYGVSYHHLSGKHLPLPVWEINDLMPKRPRARWYVAVTNWLRTFCRRRPLSSRPL